jgi:phosphate transport system substrate-binding protein
VARSAQYASFSGAGAKWTAAPGFYLLLLDQPGASSWPITGATFILMHTRQESPEKARDVLKFFDWAYKTGDGAAQQLDYVPLPASVKALIRGAWSKKIAGSDGKPVYP